MSMMTMAADARLPNDPDPMVGPRATDSNGPVYNCPVCGRPAKHGLLRYQGRVMCQPCVNKRHVDALMRRAGRPKD